jgi:acyl carrier protein
MTPEDVISRVFDVARAQVDDDTSNVKLSEWDSMGHVNLILELEAVYGVTLSPGDALEMTDVATIKRILRDRGASW